MSCYLTSRIITLLGPLRVMAHSTVLFIFAVTQFPCIVVKRIAVSCVFLLTMFKESAENVFLHLTDMCHI